MRLLVGLFVLSLYAMPGSVSAQYQVGKHYVKLPPGAQAVSGDKVEVREFFWYGCPHCYRLEPYLEAWLKNIPADVDYVRTPGVARRWLPHAQAFYTFEALGVTDRVHKDFFDAIHKKREKLDTEESLVRFLAAYGVDASKVRNNYNSFGVRTKVENAKRLNFLYAIASVPAITVDGRYKTDVSMAGGPQQLMALVNYLIDQSRQERKRAASGKQ
ncbi:MAG: thiol:disulfide interchange protein DsbA/DsbL [Acidiferrobacterales bacterium]|nr:thiol:disulfide interchange protein DsbA/DsbL [Acidiferrobacterales bacterium]